MGPIRRQTETERPANWSKYTSQPTVAEYNKFSADIFTR